MNKQEFVSAMAEKTEMTKKNAAEVVDAIIAVITETLASGEEISLSGFGKFKITERAARKGRNPQTGEEIDIEAKSTPKFSPSKAFKEAINS